MYPNVKAEMARRKLTLADLANDSRINKSVTTISLKLNGKYDLSFPEALAIKAVIGCDIPLEELFATEEANVCK